jgi:hypothetical protein
MFTNFIDTVTRGLHHNKQQTRLLASCLQETNTEEYAYRTFCRGYLILESTTTCAECLEIKYSEIL